MECIPADKLYDYLDGELKSAEEQKIVSHLSVCKRCLILAKRLEFESALIANALRSEKVTKEERERIIRTLAEKRGWKLKAPPFLRFSSFFAKSQKVIVIFALLFGISVISYSALMKDAHSEVGVFFSLSGAPPVVKEKFLSSASQVISTANSIIGGMVQAKTAIVFFILYVYFALLSLLILSMSVPSLKVSCLKVEERE